MFYLKEAENRYKGGVIQIIIVFNVYVRGSNLFNYVNID